MNRPIDRDTRIGFQLAIATAIVALVSVAMAVFAMRADAQPLPLCGGNNGSQNPTVPWTCTNSKDIPGVVGGPVVGVLTVTRTPGNTGVVSVVVTLPAPQAFDVPLQGRWHIGKSSGPLTVTSFGVIPAGQTTLTVTTGRADVCDGQFDFKVNGTAPANRLHGPWVTVPDCIDTQLIPNQPSPPALSVPPSAPPTAPPANTPGSPLSPAPGAPTLPVTGQGVNWALALAASLILAGTVLRLAGVRRP